MYLLLPMLIVFMVSCQTVEITEKKYDCTELDWFEIGRSDGVLGKPAAGFENKKKQCKNTSELEKQQYTSGWYAGIDQFCTSKQGFIYGRSGKEYVNICPSIKEETFVSAYQKGLKVFFYEKENQLITKELQGIASQTQKQGALESSPMIKKMTELETQLELNKALISEIQKEVFEDETPSSLQ